MSRYFQKTLFIKIDTLNQIIISNKCGLTIVLVLDESSLHLDDNCPFFSESHLFSDGGATLVYCFLNLCRTSWFSWSIISSKLWPDAVGLRLFLTLCMISLFSTSTSDTLTCLWTVFLKCCAITWCWWFLCGCYYYCWCYNILIEPGTSIFLTYIWWYLLSRYI